MNKKLPLRQVSLVFVLGVMGIASIGQSIFTNPITGTTPDASNPYTIGQSIDVNLIVSGIGRGSGIAGTNTNDRYNATGWNSAAFDATDYFEFTIAPNIGAKINFVSFVYTSQASGTGPTNFAFRSSIDGYTTDIGVPAAGGTTIPLSAAAFQGVTSAVTFRIYGWGASSGAGTFSINDFTFNGNVVPVTSQYYRSKNSGDWNTVTTWQFSPDNITWSNSTLVPTSLEKSVTILAGHIVTAAASISLDETTISGTLQLLQGGVLNINDGTGNDIDIQNNGVLQVLSIANYSSTVKQGSAVINVATGGKIAIDNSTVGVGTGYETFATSLSNIWNNASVFEWNSPTNFLFDNNTFFPNAGAATVPKFVINTISGPVGGANPVTVNGLLLVNRSFALAGSGAKTIRDGIAGSATLSIPLSVGTVTINGTVPVLGGGSLIIATDKNINIPNGITIPLDSVVKVMPLTASTPQFAGKGSNNFLINGTIDISTVTITNTGGAVIINGTLKTAHPGGLENTGSGGTVSTLGSSTQVNAGSTVEYNATSGNQVITGSSVLEGAASYYNIIFSGGSTKTPGNAVNVNTNGLVKITGTTTIVDATGSNIGLTSPNTTAFSMDGGTLKVGTAETLPLMDGVYNVTGGVIQFIGANQTIRGGKTYNSVEVYGSNVIAGSGDITLRTNGSFIVKNVGTFTITNNKSINAMPVDGTQAVKVENGGIFKCGSNQGFNGYAEGFGNWSSIDKTISQITLNPGSLVEYMYTGDQPITNANALIYQNLSLAASGIKTAPAGILTVQGNLTKSGSSTFAHNNGTVLLNGNNAQTFAGLTYNNLILTNNTKTTAGSSTIIDSIKINDGTTLSISGTPDTITLHSDAVKTARVGQLGTGLINYNTNGKFLVERYIPAVKAWRFLAVPVKSAQSIKDAWQEGALNSTSNPKPGYGTQLTSNRASWAADGFDLYSFGGTSMKTYNAAGDNYTGITSTLNSFDPAAGGYMTFIRGNRLATMVTSPVSATTLRLTGQLFTGDQPAITLVPGQFIPVNNPYASQIDLRSLSQSASIFYYVWDPNMSSTIGYGAFRTFSWNGTDYDVTPANAGSYGATNNCISSGQAFLVAGTGAPLQITEKAKTAALITKVPFTPMGIAAGRLRTDLYTVTSDGAQSLADGVLCVFGDDYSNLVNDMDARKNTNSGENLSLQNNGALLAVERRQHPTSRDTIFLHLAGTTQRQYQLHTILSAMNVSGTDAFLEDTYLHTRTAVYPGDTAKVYFAVTADAASYAPDRFRIIFQAAQGALPLTLTSVKAYTKNESIVVEWAMENETGTKSYQLEKSADGSSFRTSGSLPAINNGQANNYSWFDRQPLAGYNYYRIKSVGFNGQQQYSKVVKVWEGNAKSSISVYPNPSCNGIIHLLFNNQPAGKYVIRLINKWSQVVYSKQIQHTSVGSSSEDIAIDQYAAHGVYRLEVIKPRGACENINVVY